MSKKSQPLTVPDGIKYRKLEKLTPVSYIYLASTNVLSAYNDYLRQYSRCSYLSSQQPLGERRVNTDCNLRGAMTLDQWLDSEPWLS